MIRVPIREIVREAISVRVSFLQTMNEIARKIPSAPHCIKRKGNSFISESNLPRKKSHTESIRST